MRVLILSDIHSNLEAFQSILDDADSKGGFDEIWSLGDLVGYGPDPSECIKLIRQYEGKSVAGNHDLAAVKLHNTRPLEHIAKLYPKNKIDDLSLFDEVWTSGCSLLHDPFANKGELTYLREIIEQKAYLMYNAPSIFGNSGGGVFHGDGSLLGLCSRITNIQLGFGIDVMTWMGFGTHPSRLYEFFEHQELQFIYDGSDYYDAANRRKERQRKSLRHLFIEEKDADKVDVSDEYQVS